MTDTNNELERALDLVAEGMGILLNTRPMEHMFRDATPEQREEYLSMAREMAADSVAEDPLSRLTLSNRAHWALVAALRPMAPRLLVLGGGGYNPWSVGRLVSCAIEGWRRPAPPKT